MHCQLYVRTTAASAGENCKHTGWAVQGKEYTKLEEIQVVPPPSPLILMLTRSATICTRDHSLLDIGLLINSVIS